MATKMVTRKTLLRKAMALPIDDRVALAHELFDSVYGPTDDPKKVEAAWREEIERRIADVDSGKTKPVPWEEAHARIRARLKKLHAPRTSSTSRSRS